MSYLPVGIMEKILKRPSSCAVVTLNTAESMRKPQLQMVADAHGLKAETSQTVETLRNSISLHISSGHCFTILFSSNGPPDLLPLERRLPRACLDIWLDFKRTSQMEKVRASIVKAFSAPGVDILQLLLNDNNSNEEDDDDLEEDEDSDEGVTSTSSNIVSDSE
jgi:hypothetical protein